MWAVELWEQGTVVNYSRIGTLKLFGNFTVTNYGTIDGRLSLSGGNTLILAGNGSVGGVIEFGGPEDVLDLSQQDGSATLEVSNLSTIIGGNYILDGSKLHMVETRASGSGALSLGAGQAVEAVNSVLVGALSGALSGTSGASAPLAFAAPSLGGAAAAAENVAGSDPAAGRFWGTVIGGGSTGSDLSNLFGGIVAGSDASLNENLKVGLLGSYIQSATRTDGDHDLVAGTFLFGPYGEVELNVGTLSFSLLGGISGNRSERTINTDVASASFLSAFVAPSLGVEIPVLSANGTDIALVAGTSYVAGLAQGYNESGSTQNLTLGPQKLGQFDARLGLAATYEVAETDHAFRAGGFYQTHTGNSAVPVSMAGITRWLYTDASDVYGLYAGYDLGIELGNGLNLTIALDTSYRNDGVLSAAGRLSLAGNL